MRTWCILLQKKHIHLTCARVSDEHSRYESTHLMSCHLFQRMLEMVLRAGGENHVLCCAGWAAAGVCLLLSLFTLDHPSFQCRLAAFVVFLRRKPPLNEWIRARAASQKLGSCLPRHLDCLKCRSSRVWRRLSSAACSPAETIQRYKSIQTDYICK